MAPEVASEPLQNLTISAPSIMRRNCSAQATSIAEGRVKLHPFANSRCAASTTAAYACPRPTDTCCPSHVWDVDGNSYIEYGIPHDKAGRKKRVLVVALCISVAAARNEIVGAALQVARRLVLMD